MTLYVKLASFAKGFPAAMLPPARLIAFAKWASKIEFGSLGTLEAVSSEPLDVTYTDNKAATAELRKSLGIFIPLGEGSRLALWKHGDGEPAVVLLGSEGALENVAPDLDTFLLALAKQTTGIGELDDDDDDDDALASSRPALAKWLAQQGARATTKTVPEFKAWFRDVVNRHTPAATKKKQAAAASKALAKAARVKVDLKSVKSGVPAGFPLPARLEAFAKRLAKTPDGGLCEMEIEICDYPHPIAYDDLIDPELREHLVFFLRVHDIVNGEDMRFALWRHGKGAPAIVSHDAKDRVKTIAPDLDTFLLAWSRGKTGVTDLDRNGDAGTRAELAAWLAKQGAKESATKPPDAAAWIKKVTADAKAKRKDDPAVIAFCNELGIDIESITDDSALNRWFVPQHGYSMGFPFPEKDRSRQRVFTTMRFHRAKHRWWSFALGRDVSFQEFKAPLPRGVLWTMTAEQLKKLLGKPTEQDDGDLRWTDPKTKITLGVDFASQWDKIPEGEIRSVWLGA